QIREAKPDQSRGQQQTGMAQLVESGAGDHPSYGSERLVATDADAGRESEPDITAAALDGRCKSAVVNDFTANGFEAAGARQRLRTDQHTASRGGCSRATSLCNPGGRV